MKKIVAIAAFLFFGGVAVAQEATTILVPESVKDAFSCLYPTISRVSWDYDEVNYSASFKLDDRAMALLFDEYGSVVEIKNEIKLFELPLDVNHLLKKEYSDWHIGKASQINSNGTAYYETVVEKEEETMVLVFNQHGGLLLKMLL
ncbi:MAG TPA: hypothetical protein VK589_05260 [Chryseolinea sp.]|nr:hypothetical protein [Chryseolinea sp.]